ncbi:MAG: OmpH family outer membrane protein [Kiritimatiellae bacterium]|nr:OmpH family outer membrane protein [Kiritimatiellia bacterium]
MTTRRRVFGWVVAGLLAAGAVGAQDRRPSVAFVNLDRCFNEYYKTRVADAQLKAQAREFEEELKNIAGELERLQGEFNSLREESLNTALSDEVRAAKRAAAEEKVLAIREQEGRVQSFRERRTKQLEEQSRRMRRGLVGEIKEVIQKYARDQGLIAVLDSSGTTFNGVEAVLYVDPRSDITEAILRELNKGAPPDLPPPPSRESGTTNRAASNR